MKLVISVLLALAATAAAYDGTWMKLTQSQISDAVSEMEMDNAGNSTIPEVAEDLGLTVLVRLLKKTNMTDTLSAAGPFSLFAPTNRAFMRLPRPVAKFLMKNITALTEVLKYHAAKGSFLSEDFTNDQLIPSLQERKIRINIYKNGTVITAAGRPIREADQNASNGVIQEVGGVLFPPPGSLTEVVDYCPLFKTFKKALNITGLSSMLNGEGPFTVFAPTDRAFKRISRKCLDALFKNKTILTDVVKYHVVPATEYSAGLSCGDRLVTANNQTVHITKLFGRILINFSRVLVPDVCVTNGAMHIINRVLFPRRMDGQFCDGMDAADDVDYNKNNEDYLYKAFLGLQ